MLQYLLNNLNADKGSMGQQELHSKSFSMNLKILVMKELCFFKDKEKY